MRISSSGIRVALVHDFLVQYGGAERVLEVFHEMYPDAPVYTLIYEPSKMPEEYQSWDIRTPRILRFPGLWRFYKALFPVYPLVIGRMKAQGFDLVLSSSYAYAHGIGKDPQAVHICYCHTPMRFAWFQQGVYRAKIPLPLRFLFDLFGKWLRNWDFKASQQVDHYIANSGTVAQRIQQVYQKKASILCPPVSLKGDSSPTPSKDFFLIVARLVYPYKRIDIAIQAARINGMRLRIIGEGSDRDFFEKGAGPNVEFMGKVSDEVLTQSYRECRAVLMPWEEDFGIVPVEANFYGKPVIGFRSGGVLDSQIEGVTAVLFDELNVDSFLDALKRFELSRFDAAKILRNSERFKKDAFRAEMEELIEIQLEGPSDKEMTAVASG